MACHLRSLLDRRQLDGFVMREKVLRACIFRSQGAGVQDTVEFLQYGAWADHKEKSLAPSQKTQRIKQQSLLPLLGVPNGPVGKESICQYRRHRRCGFVPWIRKIPLEEKMVTHSSLLAWRTPWTEAPGGLQSMGSQKGGHGLATEQ